MAKNNRFRFNYESKNGFLFFIALKYYYYIEQKAIVYTQVLIFQIFGKVAI